MVDRDTGRKWSLIRSIDRHEDSMYQTLSLFSMGYAASYIAIEGSVARYRYQVHIRATLPSDGGIFLLNHFRPLLQHLYVPQGHI